MWIATKPLTVRREGEDVRLNVGDLVPEAEHWDNALHLERLGFLRRIKRRLNDVQPIGGGVAQVAIKIPKKPQRSTEKPN